jgi:hypothetical protein
MIGWGVITGTSAKRTFRPGLPAYRLALHPGGEHAELDAFPLREGPLRQTAVAVLRDQRHPFRRRRNPLPSPVTFGPVSISSVVVVAIPTDNPVA